MPATSKAWVQLIFAVLAAALPGLTIGWPPTFAGWVNIVILAAGAVGVWNAANTPGAPVAKLIASGVAAGCVVLLSALSDNSIGADETIQIIVAVGAAVGVYIAPNGAAAPRHAA